MAAPQSPSLPETPAPGGPTLSCSTWPVRGTRRLEQETPGAQLDPQTLPAPVTQRTDWDLGWAKNSQPASGKNLGCLASSSCGYSETPQRPTKGVKVLCSGLGGLQRVF